MQITLQKSNQLKRILKSILLKKNIYANPISK